MLDIGDQQVQCEGVGSKMELLTATSITPDNRTIGSARLGTVGPG